MFQYLLNRKNQILRKSETDLGEVIYGRTLSAHNPGILDGTCGMGMYPFEIDFQ